MAKTKKAAPVSLKVAPGPTDFMELGNDLALVFHKYNGRCYQVKEAAMIDAIARAVAGNILITITMVQLTRPRTP